MDPARGHPTTVPGRVKGPVPWAGPSTGRAHDAVRRGPVPGPVPATDILPRPRPVSIPNVTLTRPRPSVGLDRQPGPWYAPSYPGPTTAGLACQPQTEPERGAHRTTVARTRPAVKPYGTRTGTGGYNWLPILVPGCGPATGVRALVAKLVKRCGTLVESCNKIYCRACQAVAHSLVTSGSDNAT